MAWKDWSYTKKGLIIGFVLGIIIFFVLYIQYSSEPITVDFFVNPPLLLSIIIFVSKNIFFDFLPRIGMNLLMIIGFLEFLIFGSLIGALIGWVYGKIKKKN